MSHPASWHERRRKGVGGSDVASILGLSLWTTPRRLWELKTNRAQPDADNRYTERGTELEDEVVRRAAAHLGMEIGPELKFQRHPRWDEGVRLLANLDGTLGDDGIFEAKTTGAYTKTARDFRAGIIPVYYALQIHHYAATTGRTWGVIACLIGDGDPDTCDLVALRWTACPRLIELIEDVVQRWWTAYVEADLAPDYTEHARKKEAERLALALKTHRTVDDAPVPPAPMLTIGKAEQPPTPPAPARSKESTMSKFTFTPAKRKALKARIALVGPAGAGKTLSSLYIARGLAGESGRIAVIDTERDRSTLYADDVEFCHLQMETHAPRTYVEAIRAAEEAGFDVIVIDSLSHAWTGKDGALEQVDRASARSKGNSYVAWRDVTPQHNDLVEAMVGSRAHIIVTLRAKTAYETGRDERTGKATVQKVGLAPVQRDGIEYEFDLVLDIDPDHRAVVSKCRYAIPALDGAVLTKPNPEVGAMIGSWLAGGEPLKPAASSNTPRVGAEAKRLAPLVGATVAEVGGVICRALGVASSADLPSVDPARVTEVLRELEGVTDAASFEAWKQP